MSDTALHPDSERDVQRKIPGAFLGGVPRTGKQLLGWYFQLALFQKLLLSAFLGALGGSTFIGFINTYAVYRYAFRYDVRIPVEGVPYLGLAASILSFAYFAVALVCATLIYGLLRLITKLTRVAFRAAAWAWSAVLRRRAVQESRRLVSLMVVEIVTGVLSAVITLVVSLKVSTSFPARSIQVPTPVIILAVPLALVGLTALSVRPRWVKRVPLYLTLCLVGATSIALFVPSFYAARLRQIRYGGGSAITLVCENERLCEVGRTLNLFLITSDTYLLYDHGSEEIIEVPRKEVKRVRYVREDGYKLPKVLATESSFEWKRLQDWWYGR